MKKVRIPDGLWFTVIVTDIVVCVIDIAINFIYWWHGY